MAGGALQETRVLGQWLLCGLGGALACTALTLLLMGRDCPSLTWEWAVQGAMLGLLGGGGVLAGRLLAARARSGLGAGGLILAALGVCAVLTAALVLLVAVAGGLLLPYGRAWAQLSPSPSAYLAAEDLAGLGLFGGTCVGLLWWGWPSRLRRVAARKTGIVVAIVVLAGYLAWPQWSPFWAPTARNARAGSCECNLRQLGLGLEAYAADNDGPLPPCPTANDLAGIGYARLAEMQARDGRLGNAKGVLGGGAIWPYAGNAGLFLCPDDPWNLNWQGRPILDRFPEPGIGYEWNAKWAGQRLSDVPAEAWLLRDRGPWHPGGRNVLSADGRVRREGRP